MAILPPFKRLFEASLAILRPFHFVQWTKWKGLDTNEI